LNSARGEDGLDGILDIVKQKTRVFLLRPIYSPFYWWMLKKTIPVLFSGLKNPCKKIRETRKLKPIHE